MGEGHAGAGEDQDAAHPPDRRLLLLRRLVEVLVVHDLLEQPEGRHGEAEAQHRRNQQREQDAPDLMPIDAFAKRPSVTQRILDRDADQRPDQGMGG